MIAKDSKILITGGTGSFGKAFVARVLAEFPEIDRLVVFSRDELKQYEMQLEFSEDKYPGLRYFLGDIRDKERLDVALRGIDTVIHAAALKQVPAAEYNPFEFIKTNVIGSENLINACITNEVKTVIALSTDKAAAPINLYGASKLCADKLFIASKNFIGRSDIRLSVVRYGNVMGSRGSVIPLFIRQKHTGVLPITHPDMTRFNITLKDSVEMVMWAIEHCKGGEILVPKIPSYKITDLASAIGPNCEQRIVGTRPGEKMHEEMITESDSYFTVDIGKFYSILSSNDEAHVNSYLDAFGGQKVSPKFSYHSGNNERFLSVDEIQELIEKEL